jgi:hypothetical protein
MIWNHCNNKYVYKQKNSHVPDGEKTRVPDIRQYCTYILRVMRRREAGRMILLIQG